jgi:hypothetical protein
MSHCSGAMFEALIQAIGVSRREAFRPTWPWRIWDLRSARRRERATCRGIAAFRKHTTDLNEVFPRAKGSPHSATVVRINVHP